MEAQTIINAVFAMAGAMGGFILNAVWSGLKDLREADMALTTKVQNIEVLVAGSYVKTDAFSTMTEALFRKLDKIESKLDTKMDKVDCNTIHDRRT